MFPPDSSRPEISSGGWPVRVISKKRLREFWESRPHDSDIAQRYLLFWYAIVEKASWANWAALKQTFGSADRVGHCVVFDVGNNRYRLVAIVNCNATGEGRVYVRKVMDHAEYDKNRWPDECGCNTPPPKNKSITVT